MTKDEAESRTILRCTVGSTAHGVNVQDGLEDYDEMGVCIERMSDAFGVGVPFEQFIYRTAVEREGRMDARSVAGDTDLVIYSLRKWARLALNGNPTILLPVFAPVVSSNALGEQLRALAPAIVSKQAGHALLGYLRAQRGRLTGERGQKRVNRPELIEQFGFDTKYAMHMLRLGMQGVELLDTGRLQLPMVEHERVFLRDVRSGVYTEAYCVEASRDIEAKLVTLMRTAPLQEEPDTDVVNRWMQRAYFGMWSSDRVTLDRQEFPDLKWDNLRGACS